MPEEKPLLTFWQIQSQHAIFKQALLKVCNETDWCPVCNCHPSHEHGKECPLKEG